MVNHAITTIEDADDSYSPPTQDITYNCFTKVASICDTLEGGVPLLMEFTYGLGNQRIKSVQSRNGSIERVKWYAGDYEEDSTASGIKKYHYISGGNGLTAIFVQDGSGNDTMYHVMSDHLGSLTTIVNATSDEVQRFSYNAWGTPRDPDNWDEPFTGDLFAGRGFTNHEHLEEFDLINMNGRIYDPVIGRFLSPDPFVQATGYPNNYNRYSYVLNNPLRFTDPSGYMYDPAEHEPTGPLLIRGYAPRYPKSWQGQGGDPFSGVGFDYGNLASAYGLSMNSRPPEVGTTWADVVNTGWVYNWGMGNYVNSYSRTIMSASDFGAYILPSMGTRLSEDQMTSVLNGVRSLGSQTQSSSGDRSWNMPLVQALGFDNHIFQYNRTTGKFFAPWTDIEVDPLAILAMSMANSAASNDGTLEAGVGQHLIGPALMASGIKINALKPVGALGSKPGSSVASYTLSKAFPQTFTKTLGKKVGTKVATRVGTNVIGRALGRFVPYLGAGITGWDIGWYLGTNYGISTWFDKSEESRILQEIHENGIWWEE